MGERMKLLGDPRKPIGLMGSAGEDSHVTAVLDHSRFPEGGKTPMSFEEQARLVEEHGFILSPDRVYPSQTGAHIAGGIQKLRHPDAPRLIFMTPLSRTDPTSRHIKRVLTTMGIDVRATPFDGRNPHSVVISNGEKHAWVAKDTTTPTIKHFDPTIGVLGFSSLGGDHSDTYNNGVDHAEALNIPRFVIGSESQIKKLADNNKLKAAYFRTLRGSAFFGNVEEATLLITLLGREPQKDPKKLAYQFQSLFDTSILCLTNGPKEDICIDDEGTMHILHIKPKPKDKIKTTLGVGDAKAAAMFAGLQQGDTIESSQVNSAHSAGRVLDFEDGFTGQSTHGLWIPNAQAIDTTGWRHETHTPKTLATSGTLIFSSTK